MNKLIIKKFGGTSVANAERIEVVAELIVKSVEEGNQVAVVLSAISNVLIILPAVSTVFTSIPNSKFP